jgi:hypothetical protein
VHNLTTITKVDHGFKGICACGWVGFAPTLQLVRKVFLLHVYSVGEDAPPSVEQRGGKDVLNNGPVRDYGF